MTAWCSATGCGDPAVAETLMIDHGWEGSWRPHCRRHIQARALAIVNPDDLVEAKPGKADRPELAGVNGLLVRRLPTA